MSNIVHEKVLRSDPQHRVAVTVKVEHDAPFYNVCFYFGFEGAEILIARKEACGFDEAHEYLRNIRPTSHRHDLDGLLEYAHVLQSVSKLQLSLDRKAFARNFLLSVEKLLLAEISDQKRMEKYRSSL